MSEWKELNTLQDVAAAQAACEEIQADIERRGCWTAWSGSYWDDEFLFRSRPAKKTKTIVLREALFSDGSNCYDTRWCDDLYVEHRKIRFVKWLDTPERIVEVEE